MQERCFAHRADGECVVVTGGVCPGYDKCTLYMSIRDRLISEEEHDKRLKSLPIGKQAYIAEVYYAGSMPWKLSGTPTRRSVGLDGRL